MGAASFEDAGSAHGRGWLHLGLLIPWVVVVASLHVALAALVAPAVAQDAEGPAASGWTVRTLDRESGSALVGVLVFFAASGGSWVTDSLGQASAPPATGDSVRVVATRVGYTAIDTVVASPAGGTTLELRLVRSAVALAPLTVEAERAGTDSRELARRMFGREVAIGSVGMTRTEARAVPALAETDVLRSLQSVAGVTSINDYGAEMFVRGGDADQIAILLDGAPVFGPYHMFGMFGLFNSDAIESMEFHRGSIPARYGGALSGVVSARQATGDGEGVSISGGLSALGLRAAVNGVLPWAHGRYLAAGRSATVDVARLSLPFSFYDMNVGLDLYPSEEHRIRVSLLASNDEFAWKAYGFGGSLSSEWANLVSSFTWSWVRRNRITSDLSAYVSRYEGNIGNKPDVSGVVTTNRIRTLGLRAEVSVRGEVTGMRGGVVLEGGPVSLLGTGTGAYMEGEAAGTYLHASGFAEVEHWIGPLRLVPGLRAGAERNSSRVFAEPRLSARLHLGAFALSGSLDRSFQFLSVLRDARYFVPGAPMWFLRDKGHPVSVADGFSLSLDYWRGGTWTASALGWTRRLTDLPSWRPESSRRLATLEYHDGIAHGWDLAVQKHAGSLRGWLSYQLGRVRLRDAEDNEYRPRWDRRHEVDATVSLVDLRGLSLSLRGTVASGAPFWYPVGLLYGIRYDPNGWWAGEDRPPSENPLRGLGPRDDRFAILSDVQGQLPYYGRLDISARYAFHIGDWSVEPYLSVPNVTKRENILTYTSLRFGDPQDGEHFQATRQLPPLPFVGLDFTF